MDFELSRDFLFNETDRVLRSLTDPEFMRTMQQFRALPGDDRTTFAQQNLTPTSLKDRGVALPDDMRVSSRTFEDERLASQPVDVEGGMNILRNIQANRPQLLDSLSNNHPQLFNEVMAFAGNHGGLGGGGLGGGGGLPAGGGLGGGHPAADPAPGRDVPGRDVNVQPGSNPDGVSGCACGGAATVCGGAGAGS
jgi:hypothetical protein